MTSDEGDGEIIDQGAGVDQTPIYAELVDELGVADQPSIVAAACDNGVSDDAEDGVDGEQVPSSGGLPAEATVRGPAGARR
jgi:hypothetical protein